ncbi:DUF5662 family protein [Mesorhizobium sp.]|uniref:DUF5662 family protein n=1 Tax=Mesorhizobium sp. TaxID=1871066 RepID=UPI000FE91904|nr:DUF5662 family protein [Mesorhizobium sp.]RWP29888.1 MAG: hypothetical protein EOR03_25870 [Mesorhizobium sp.]RWP69546.1 MAG: hypothetical protein EOR07_03195 [Mesorhizobium sp.]
MSTAVEATRKHIAQVRQLLGMFAAEMIRRGDVHDASKFDPIEMGPLEAMQEIIDRDGPALPGSEEYKRRTDMLGPMIAHHRMANSHHPEFYEFEYGGDCMNGVNGMDLFDLVEMFFDWRAANLDRDAGAPMSLSYSIEKYKIDPMLASILRNTAERLGYAVK